MRFGPVYAKKGYTNRREQYAVIQSHRKDILSQGIQNLLTLRGMYQEFQVNSKTISQAFNRKNTRRYIYTYLLQNFALIFKHLTARLSGQNDYVYQRSKKCDVHSSSNSLCVSAEKITTVLEQIRFWLKQTKKHEKIFRKHIRFNALLDISVFAYSEIFHRGKSLWKTDLSFLDVLVHIDRKGKYTNFMRELLASSVYNTIGLENITSKKKNTLPHTCDVHVERSLRGDLNPSYISLILRIVASNRFLFDQRLCVLLCSALEKNVECVTKLYSEGKNADMENHHLMTAQQGYMCISALCTMRVHHKVANSVLMYMAHLPTRCTILDQTMGYLSFHFDVNILIKSLWKVCERKDVLSDTDFINYIRRIFLSENSVNAEGASYLVAIMAKRDTQYVSFAKLGEMEHNMQYLDTTSIPRFYQNQDTKAGEIFSLQNDDTSIIVDVLKLIDSILIKRIFAMTIHDICRVVRAFTSDFIGVGSGEVWKLILARIDSLYPKKPSPSMRQMVQVSNQETSSDIIQINSKKPNKSVHISKQLVVSHATLLVFLPKLEARLHKLTDEDEPSVEIDNSLLDRIAKSIPLVPFQRYSRQYADVSMMLRRAFCDFPHLYDINPSLWDTVKSTKIKASYMRKRRLYRTMITLKSCAKDIFAKGPVSSDTINSRVRFEATRERVRKSSYFDKYRMFRSASTLNRLR